MVKLRSKSAVLYANTVLLFNLFLVYVLTVNLCLTHVIWSLFIPPPKTGRTINILTYWTEIHTEDKSREVILTEHILSYSVTNILLRMISVCKGQFAQIQYHWKCQKHSYKHNKNPEKCQQCTMDPCKLKFNSTYYTAPIIHYHIDTRLTPS